MKAYLGSLAVVTLLTGCASAPLMEVGPGGEPGCKSLGAFEVSKLCRGSLDNLRTCNEIVKNRILAEARSKGGNAVEYTGDASGVAYLCPPEAGGK